MYAGAGLGAALRTFRQRCSSSTLRNTQSAPSPPPSNGIRRQFRQISRQRRYSEISFSRRCVASSGGKSSEEKESLRLLRAAGSIGAISAASKVIGLVREASTAAVFGLGPAADAYNCALLLPSFVVTVIAGLNGPLHSAVTAVLSKCAPGDETASRGALQAASLTLFGAAALALFLCRGPVIALLAPGLPPATAQLAAQQLGLLAPSVLLSAAAAVSISSLTARGAFAAPAAAPTLTSVAVLAALAWPCGYQTGDATTHRALAVAAGYSVGTGAGTAAMALAEATLPQRPESRMSDYNSSNDDFQQPSTSGRTELPGPRWFMEARGRSVAAKALREASAVFLPASASSLLLAAVAATDVFFASADPGGAAALSFAFLLAMAPMGVASTSLVAPLLPLLARMHASGDSAAFARAVSRAAAAAAAAGALLAATWGALAQPVVSLALQRSAFDAAAAARVGLLLAVYSAGAAAYLVREALVRACYALGDGAAPLAASVAALLSNAGLNWLLGVRLGWGTTGIVVATVVTNALSTVLIALALARRLPELRWRPLLSALGVSAAAGLVAACASRGAHSATRICTYWLALSVGQNALASWLGDGVAVAVAGGAGFAVFTAALQVSRHPLLSPAVTEIGAAVSRRLFNRQRSREQ